MDDKLELWSVIVFSALVIFLFGFSIFHNEINPASMDCDDFHYWGAAQEFFEDHDPESDPYHLDGDKDGLACEGL